MGYDSVIDCYFLADGNDTIGMGHIMRCIAIAEIMVERNIDIKFVTKYKYGYDFLINKGFKALKYNSIEDIEKSICGNCIVIDKYDISKSMFSILRKIFENLVYIDDLNLFDYNVDLVINSGIFARNINYNFSSNKKYLLGIKYCILRKEFRNIIRKPVNKFVKNILITTGGSDKYNMTEKILKFLLHINLDNNVKFNVIVGQAFKDKYSLYKFADERIIYYKSPDNMAEIMNNCDIAVSAGGNTLYELCSLGVPTIAFIVADNQIELVRGLERENCVFNIGFYSNLKFKDFKDIFIELIGNFDLRKKISEKQINTVNLNGAVDIVEYIINLKV